MAVKSILRMGDPRLLEKSQPVTKFYDPANRGLIQDMFDTMEAASGVGLAAPQIGVGLQVVIFGFDKSERYPDAPPVPQTILINPVITPLTDEEELGWEECPSVPGCVAKCLASSKFAISELMKPDGKLIEASKAFMPAWSSMRVTT